jgi:tRNA A-37 threonylcarbamoyl transferase component Bud32
VVEGTAAVSEADHVDDRASANISLADQVDLICDEFEHAWLRGEVPRIEDFLNRHNGLVREGLLVELLLVDREFRIRRGESATRDDYRDRFPELSSVIDSLEFATIDDRVRAGISTIPGWKAPVPGGRVAHFELLEEIGSGASGTVWKARDTKLRRLVALKVPRQHGHTGPERERFRREGQAAAQLRHPNIVTVFEVGEDRHQVFIVAEYVEGVDLSKWLSQRRPTFQETTEVAAQLAEALHHAHEQGIIHRDLKPANVLMDNQGRPHVTDFGLAKWTADTARMTIEGNILGTPAYMSPEQARGEIGLIDRRTDVYGLGSLLYEMLTASSPFEGDLATIVKNVICDEPRRPRSIDSNIPRDLETICCKAMEKEPARRYPSAQEMAVDLRRFLRGEPIFARRASTLEKSWRWLRRHPALAASVLLTLIVVITAATIIRSLIDRNYRLQGYRPVRITSIPSGARVAIVPIDDRTGEPDATKIIHPNSAAPLTTLLRPGDYLIEAVLGEDQESMDFVEVYRTIIQSGMQSNQRMDENRKDGNEADLFHLTITIPRTRDIVAEMVAVPIDKDFRSKNPRTPEFLYVDSKESTAEESGYEIAKISLNESSKRLPSAMEYDAIIKATREHKMRNSTGRPADVDDLFGGLAEWTSTRYDFSTAGGDQVEIAKLRSWHVLKGNGDPLSLPGLLQSPSGFLIAPTDSNSKLIGFRGVRSGSPRFLKQ